jgi:hypothetical protein
VIFLTTQLGYALTPPLNEEELRQSADLIVIGEVSQTVRCLKLLEETDCFEQWQYSANLKIQRVLKGQARLGQEIRIIFYQNDYRKSDCVGDQGAALHAGDRGTYYLKEGEGESYSPLHWSAVKLTHASGYDLPLCEK